jgi:RND family efflux transporter MFP subunit
MKRVLGLFAVLIAGVILFYARQTPPPAAAGTPSALVTVRPLQTGSLPDIVTTYGTVSPVPAAVLTITAPFQADVTAVTIRAGALVPQGAPLLRLAPTPATKLAYAQAQAALALDSALVHHTQTLLAGHLATATQLLQAQTDRDNARATLAALQAQGAAGPLTLTAPCAALVSSLATAPGTIAAQGDALMTLVPPHQMELDIGLTTGVAAGVTAGDKASLTPLGGGQAFTTTVTFRAAATDPAAGTVPAAIALPPGAALLGQTFRADITTGQISGTLVPHEAVLASDSGGYYVMQDDNLTAKQIPVQVLGSDGTNDIITGPFAPGEPVIVTGAYQLSDGDPIRLGSTP